MAVVGREKDILEKVKMIVSHHKQLTKAKGELFNIYSILNLKTKEVRTHSAFIAELLNPKGTHLMGAVFLEAFINLFPENTFVTKNNDTFNIESATVFVEHFVGRIDKNKKTGGRIDIVIQDGNGYTISIENKIDAPDQEFQIERYYNYNKSKNKVVYLTSGEEPLETSSGKLVYDKDFFVISYQTEIINWLETCQTIASDQPILRESIKQYKILIQKITNTLGDKQDKELKSIVIENLEEASLIASKYNLVVKNIRNDFRNKITELLNVEVKGYSISKRNDISKKYASIWFDSEKSNIKQAWFGVETFSGNGHLGGELFIGIYNANSSLNLEKEYVRLNKGWVHHEVLTHDTIKINVTDSVFLKSINTYEKLEAVAKNVVEQIVFFIEEHNHLIEE
ncbi:PD-(D/E)XK nuclease family protein [Aquimarina sp. RZ0]|uniref:PDDEXK-like family protein n=1 Tax=Aquimarina sp. RZ0 TaxID=2607730 RepID=UPI0011F3F9F0|nr:PD-(D/E)XK nuclease family protein [Aquimarina sp. RZ0]KAA1245840.1 hypothetical protein F0000_10620 [Aquimarina sp. RZ0]